eukprot:gene16635-biopygen11319
MSRGGAFKAPNSVNNGTMTPATIPSLQTTTVTCTATVNGIKTTARRFNGKNLVGENGRMHRGLAQHGWLQHSSCPASLQEASSMCHYLRLRLSTRTLGLGLGAHFLGLGSHFLGLGAHFLGLGAHVLGLGAHFFGLGAPTPNFWCLKLPRPIFPAARKYAGSAEHGRREPKGHTSFGQIRSLRSICPAPRGSGGTGHGESPPPLPATISSKRRRLRPRGGGGPTGSLDTPQCRREHSAPVNAAGGGAVLPRLRIGAPPSVARARAAVGLGLHPAALPRPRARCSRFGEGWRRAEAVAEFRSFCARPRRQALGGDVEAATGAWRPMVMPRAARTLQTARGGGEMGDGTRTRTYTPSVWIVISDGNVKITSNPLVPDPPALL